VTKYGQNQPSVDKWRHVSLNLRITSFQTGYLLTQDYQEGSPVRTGDILFEGEPRPFRAVVDQANAQVNVANAQVTQAMSDVAAAKAEIDRAEAAQFRRSWR